MKSNPERIDLVLGILRFERDVYRNSSGEAKNIAAWEAREGKDVLGAIDLLGSTLFGLASTLSSGNLTDKTIGEQLSYLNNLSLFDNKNFLNWFSVYSMNYPTVRKCIIMLEFSRLELIDILISMEPR